MRKIKQEEFNRIIKELEWNKRVFNDKNASFVTVKSQNFTLNNGITITREQILKNKKDGSAVIVVPKVGDEYLVTIEPRVFTNKKVATSFPAGYIEDGELAEDAALRELMEETGYVPQKLIHLDSFYQDEGISAAYNHLFLAENCIKRFDQSLDDDEVVKYMTFYYDELLELEKAGYISGSNSKLALCKIKNMNRR